jgi:hypothetical protein
LKLFYREGVGGVFFLNFLVHLAVFDEILRFWVGAGTLSYLAAMGCLSSTFICELLATSYSFLLLFLKVQLDALLGI